MPRSSKKPPPRRGEANRMGMPTMGMFGMYGNEEEDAQDDAGFEDELSQILGESSKSKPAASKPKGKQLMDWGELNAQISASMKDIDEETDSDDSDGDVDDGLLSELQGLVEEDTLQTPIPKRGRSPSPQPQASDGGQLALLTERKKHYGIAIQNAQSAGEGAKVRRLQRQSKTLDGLLRQVKAGKTINEEDIPPQCALGKPKPSSEVPPPVNQPAVPPITVSSPPIKPESPEKAPPTSPKPTPPPRPAAKISPTKVDKESEKMVETLTKRQLEFKKAAFAAKNSGDKQEALKYMKIFKQFDSVIASAKEGNQVDLDQIPTLQEQPASPPKPDEKPQPVVPEPQPVAPQSPPRQPEPSGPQAIPVPKTLLEGLLQRQQKYKSSAEQATAENNGSKARRMTRIMKQYDNAIKAHKAGRQFNFEELPVPIGFPPLPGEKQTQPEDMLAKAESLLSMEDEERPEPPVTSAAHAASAAIQPKRLTPSPKPKAQPTSPKPSSSSGGQRSAYQNQVEFLINRQNAFKEAALVAKNKGDKETALEMLRKMKGFEPMINQAKGGLKVDITNVPQPPIIRHSDSKQEDEKFEILNAPKKHEDDDETFKSLLTTLKEQIKKARGYSDQFTHSGDVNGANMFDRLSADSQRDYEFVKNLQRHSDPPPRYYYDNKTFECVNIIPELSSGDMELVIVQLFEMDGKDGKSFIEWEMPFPHDNPIKGKTEEFRSSSVTKLDAEFRVPITRKSKSFQRAIKNKSVKLVVMQKGGFLRSDKIIGSAAVKLAQLETACEIRSVEELHEGRQVVGKVEVKVRMRTPLMTSESRKVTEKWLIVSHDHVSARVAPRPSQGKKAQPPPKSQTQEKGSSPPSSQSKIGSLEVLALEKKMVDAKIQSYQTKGETPPTSALQNQKSVETKMNTTKRFLQGGGLEAKRAYVKYLKGELGNLTKEAQMNVKHGRQDQAKFALTKRKLIENELTKIAPSNTYL